jgi:hypothetical protein
MYETIKIITLIVEPLSVVALFLLLSFYVNKFLKNVKKNEKLVWTLIFIHPSAHKAFKILTIITLTFNLGLVLSIVMTPFLIPATTYLLLIGLIYFFRTLTEITKEK